jgi:hypothetical protein
MQNVFWCNLFIKISWKFSFWNFIHHHHRRRRHHCVVGLMSSKFICIVDGDDDYASAVRFTFGLPDGA